MPILSNSNCQNTAGIYIIHCKLCNFFYIGETGRSFQDRIRDHLYYIKRNFLDKEVAVHFNQINHNYLNDFEFFIFKDKIYNKEDRHYIENDLINIFITLKGKIMNNYIPSLFYMKKIITFN